MPPCSTCELDAPCNIGGLDAPVAPVVSMPAVASRVLMQAAAIEVPMTTAVPLVSMPATVSLVSTLTSGSLFSIQLCCCDGWSPGHPPELCHRDGQSPGCPPELCICDGWSCEALQESALVSLVFLYLSLHLSVPCCLVFAICHLLIPVFPRVVLDVSFAALSASLIYIIIYYYYIPKSPWSACALV